MALKNNPHLRTTFILDYHRSTRLSRPSTTTSDPEKSPLSLSTAHLLLPLIEEFGDRVEVWFFRSPNLKGLLEKVVPERYDEGWGTWHGKWYAVDDEVVLSGYVSPLSIPQLLLLSHSFRDGRVGQQDESKSGSEQAYVLIPI